MKNNKLLETLSVLSVLERKRFRNAIKNRKRSGLLSLYDLCLSCLEKKSALPGKEMVYVHLFGEAYTKEKDFLLRNEYRLLTNELEEFLRSAAVGQYYPGVAEAARLRRILESGNSSLFKKEFDAAAIKYKNDLVFWQAVDPVYLLYFIPSRPISIPHFEEIKQRIDECKDRLGRLYNRFLSDYEVKTAYTHKVHSVLADEVPVSRPSETVGTQNTDHVVDYRKLKAQTYYVNGTEKIKTLLAAGEILKKNRIPELDIDEARWLMANVGLEYYLQYDFKNAVAYFDELFSSPGIETFNRLPEAALNYLSALISIGDHEKAVNAIAPYEEKMTASPAVFYKYICLKSLALLFLRKAPACRKELNRVEEHVVDFDFLYWRVALVLSFAVENRWEEAQNEFRNLQKTKTVRHNTRSDLDSLIFTLDNLIRMALAKGNGKKISATAWAECDDKLNHMLKSRGDFLHPPRLIRILLHELKTPD